MSPFFKLYQSRQWSSVAANIIEKVEISFVFPTNFLQDIEIWMHSGLILFEKGYLQVCRVITNESV